MVATNTNVGTLTICVSGTNINKIETVSGLPDPGPAARTAHSRRIRLPCLQDWLRCLLLGLQGRIDASLDRPALRLEEALGRVQFGGVGRLHHPESTACITALSPSQTQPSARDSAVQTPQREPSPLLPLLPGPPQPARHRVDGRGQIDAGPAAEAACRCCPGCRSPRTVSTVGVSPWRGNHNACSSVVVSFGDPDNRHHAGHGQPSQDSFDFVEDAPKSGMDAKLPVLGRSRSRSPKGPFAADFIPAPGIGRSL